MTGLIGAQNLNPAESRYRLEHIPAHPRYDICHFCAFISENPSRRISLPPHDPLSLRPGTKKKEAAAPSAQQPPWNPTPLSLVKPYRHPGDYHPCEEVSAHDNYRFR